MIDSGQTLRILCLAYSRKHGGRCVAGLRTDGGGWVRPVSIKADGTLTYTMCTLEDGSMPRLLDVIDIDMRRPRPLSYQPENWLIERKPWRLVQRPAAEAESCLCHDHVVTGPELFGSREDRIVADRAQGASLALVKAQDLEWVIRLDPVGRRRTRVRFKLGDAPYELGLTDDDLERRLRIHPPGDYPMRACKLFENAHSALLTVSLGEPYEGFCYKLVAAVLALES